MRYPCNKHYNRFALLTSAQQENTWVCGPIGDDLVLMCPFIIGGPFFCSFFKGFFVFVFQGGWLSAVWPLRLLLGFLWLLVF